MRLREQVFSAQVVCVLAVVLVAFHRASGTQYHRARSDDRCSLSFGYTYGGQPVAPQTSPSPFQVTVSPKQFTTGTVVTVTIESNVTFREIILQAWSVGTWQKPPSGYKLLTCSYNDGPTLTSTNNDVKSPNVQFQWTAPSMSQLMYSGYVTIVASVAISNDVFWTRQRTVIEELIFPITARHTDACTKLPCPRGVCWFWTSLETRICGCDSAYEGIECDHLRYNPYCPDNTPCGFGGDCIEESPYFNPGTFDCVCRSLFQGSDCTDLNPCEPNPCMNGGDCSQASGQFRCNCTSVFTGTRCEIGPCASNPCQNSGTCTHIGSMYACTCVNGYDGDVCQTPVTCSRTYPCANLMTCDAAGQCICASGYLGDRCEIDMCQYFCLNGGTCSVNNMGIAICSCKMNYKGERCQIKKCQNFCLNGGTCSVNNTGNAICSCEMNYKGERCQIIH